MYTVQEAARELRVSVRTIRRWIRNGIIAAIQPAGCGGRWRIPESEIERLRTSTS